MWIVVEAECDSTECSVVSPAICHVLASASKNSRSIGRCSWTSANGPSIASAWSRMPLVTSLWP